jgi:uncharacterized protein (DUF1330 family)
MSTTKKGYWMVMLTVTDPEGYKAYIAAIGEATAKFGARYLIRGGQHELPEDEGFSRHVVVEFDSYAIARECYHAAGYQAAAKLRRAASRGHFAIVEGA